MKRVPRCTIQIDEPSLRGKNSLKFVMLCWAEEAKLWDRKESSSWILIRSHKLGFTKPFENNITLHYERMDVEKTPKPNNTSNLFSNFFISFGLAAVSTAPTSPREIGSPPIESRRKRGLWGRSEARPRGMWQKLWTRYWRSHCTCVSWWISHQVRVPFLWLRWYVHNQLDGIISKFRFKKGLYRWNK